MRTGAGWDFWGGGLKVDAAQDAGNTGAFRGISATKHTRLGKMSLCANSFQNSGAKGASQTH